MSIPVFAAKTSVSKGRPVRSCRRKAANSSARAIRKSFRDPVRPFGGGQAESHARVRPAFAARGTRTTRALTGGEKDLLSFLEVCLS